MQNSFQDINYIICKRKLRFKDFYICGFNECLALYIAQLYLKKITKYIRVTLVSDRAAAFGKLCLKD